MTHTSGISPRALRIVAAHSAIAGLCPLIPLPYVDDMLIRRINGRMCKTLFEAHDLTLTRSAERVLTNTPSQWLRGAVTSVALFPLRKAMRKIVYLLAIRDCADVASAVFHDGWLLAHLLEHGAGGHDLDDTRYLQKVRKAMLRTYEEIDPAPLRRALVGAFLGAKVGAGHAVRAVKRVRRGEPVETRGVESLVREMGAAAGVEWHYLEALEKRFRRHLGLKAQASLDAPPRRRAPDGLAPAARAVNYAGSRGQFPASRANEHRAYDAAHGEGRAAGAGRWIVARVPGLLRDPGELDHASGLPTNAIFGFATMFRKLFAGRMPDRGAVVFDSPGPTFREEQVPRLQGAAPGDAGRARAAARDDRPPRRGQPLPDPARARLRGRRHHRHAGPARRRGRARGGDRRRRQGLRADGRRPRPHAGHDARRHLRRRARAQEVGRRAGA